MPAIDNCEPSVIKALEKEDWVVTHKNFGIRVARENTVFADLRLINEKSKTPIIVIEIKCFPDTRTTLSEFHHAIGQYIWYRNALLLKELELRVDSVFSHPSPSLQHIFPTQNHSISHF